MTESSRCVLPELLDTLAPDDPVARRSRRDLRRIHRAMGTLSILQRSIGRLHLAQPPRHILELGAGDGTLLLRLGRALHGRWPHVRLTLLDRQDVVDTGIRDEYGRLGWEVQKLRMDALAWSRESSAPRYDLCIATLFLHHLDFKDLEVLLAAVAARTDAFVACEPRRNSLARLGSSLVGLLGANRVTREDALTSVAAGFAGLELTRAWPRADESWVLDEYYAPPFTHSFAAVRATSGNPDSDRGR